MEENFIMFTQQMHTENLKKVIDERAENTSNYSLEEEKLFWKVFHNKFLFRKIFYHLESMEIEPFSELYEYDKKDETPYNKIVSYSREKFKNIKSLQSMIERGLWELIKTKYRANEYIHVYEHSIYQMLEFCKDVECFQIVYENQKLLFNNYDIISLLIECGNLVLLEWVLKNTAIINEDGEIQIGEHHLKKSISHGNTSILKLIMEKLNLPNLLSIPNFDLKKQILQLTGITNNDDMVEFILNDIIVSSVDLITTSYDKVTNNCCISKMNHLKLLELGFIDDKFLLSYSESFESVLDIKIIIYKWALIDNQSLNEIKTKINEIEMEFKGDQETQIKQLFILLMEFNVKSYFKSTVQSAYLQKFDEVLNSMDESTIYNYTFGNFSIVGLNHLIDREYRIREDIDTADYESVRVGAFKYTKENCDKVQNLLINNPNQIIEFIKLYYSQDKVVFKQWKYLMNLLLFSNYSTVQLFTKILEIDGFQKKYFILPKIYNQSHLKPFSKLKWYMDTFNILNCDSMVVCNTIDQVEYIDYIIENKEFFKLDSCTEFYRIEFPEEYLNLTFSTIQLASYFKQKFPTVTNYIYFNFLKQSFSNCNDRESIELLFKLLPNDSIDELLSLIFQLELDKVKFIINSIGGSEYMLSNDKLISTIFNRKRFNYFTSITIKNSTYKSDTIKFNQVLSMLNYLIDNKIFTGIGSGGDCSSGNSILNYLYKFCLISSDTTIYDIDYLNYIFNKNNIIIQTDIFYTIYYLIIKSIKFTIFFIELNGLVNFDGYSFNTEIIKQYLVNGNESDHGLNKISSLIELNQIISFSTILNNNFNFILKILIENLLNVIKSINSSSREVTIDNYDYETENLKTCYYKLLGYLQKIGNIELLLYFALNDQFWKNQFKEIFYENIFGEFYYILPVCENHNENQQRLLDYINCYLNGKFIKLQNSILKFIVEIVISRSHLSILQLLLSNYKYPYTIFINYYTNIIRYNHIEIAEYLFSNHLLLLNGTDYDDFYSIFEYSFINGLIDMCLLIKKYIPNICNITTELIQSTLSKKNFNIIKYFKNNNLLSEFNIQTVDFILKQNK